MAKNKKLWLGLGALVLAVAILVGVYFAFGPKGVEGSKTIEVAVVLADGSTQVEETIHTDAEFLREALDQNSSIKLEGEESDYGLFVQTVNGVTADYDANGEWWCFTKGGEMLNTGVDTTPIADGDHFEITLTK